MFSGFVITADGFDALGIFDEYEGVRYATRLEDGRGLAAYDVDTLADVMQLGLHGEILSEIPGEQQGDWDELLRRMGAPSAVPSSPKGPKRQMARGDERFCLLECPHVAIPASDWLTWVVSEFEPRGAVLVASMLWDELTLYVLLEVGLEWECGLPMLWDSAAVEWKDKRLLQVVR